MTHPETFCDICGVLLTKKNWAGDVTWILPNTELYEFADFCTSCEEVARKLPEAIVTLRTDWNYIQL